VTTDARTPTGPLTQKVLEYAGTIERTVPAAKDDGFTDAAWAPLASLVATDVFERVGIWREVMNWQEYIAFLTKFASAKGFESTVRRITETQNSVFYEIEEHHIKDGKVNIVNSMNVFEFDDQAKIRRLDVYIQGIVEPSVPVQGLQ
jgi:limonene-1,2-epoxide hydrolase